MNNKRFFTVLMMMVSVITLSFSLFSCSGSDDSESAPPAKAPKVVSTSPSNNATDIPTGSINVQITYDQEVSLDNSKQISVSGGTIMKGATANGKVVSLSVGCYDYETKVTITIPEGFVNVSGAKADAYTLSFTTAKKPNGFLKMRPRLPREAMGAKSRKTCCKSMRRRRGNNTKSLFSIFLISIIVNF